MAENYNVDEIKRFAVRLEEQVSNSRIAFDNIDYDLRRLCDIFRKYDGEVSRELSSESNNFADYWYTAKSDISQTCIKLAGSMLGFYNATSANQVVSLEELRDLKSKFAELYSSNPELSKASSSTGKHEFVWANGQTVAERQANGWKGNLGNEAGTGVKPSAYDRGRNAANINKTTSTSKERFIAPGDLTDGW